jgi:hypothetical protein
MKLFLIGLLVLGSVSAFADHHSIECRSANGSIKIEGFNQEGSDVEIAQTATILTIDDTKLVPHISFKGLSSTLVGDLKTAQVEVKAIGKKKVIETNESNDCRITREVIFSQKVSIKGINGTNLEHETPERRPLEEITEVLLCSEYIRVI